MTVSRWEDEPRPEWLIALDAACVRTSQNRVATELGVSAAMVSMIRRGTYPGDYSGVALLATGKYLNGTVICPALREIRADVCVGHQRRAAKFQSSGHPERIRMFKACRACPRFTKGET